MVCRNDVVDVLVLDLVTVVGNRHAAAVVEALEVGAGHGSDDFANFTVGFVLGLGHGIG